MSGNQYNFERIGRAEVIQDIWLDPQDCHSIYMLNPWRKHHLEPDPQMFQFQISAGGGRSMEMGAPLDYYYIKFASFFGVFTSYLYNFEVP
jgi:hypothetical protein